MRAVWDRVDAELIRRGQTWAQLGREIGATDQRMNNWKRRGVPASQYQAIATALGWKVDDLIGDDPPPNPVPTSGGLGIRPADQDLSHPTADDEPTTTSWEFVLSAATLPPRFRLAVPDDALAPGTPRGTVLIFSTSAQPAFGHGVLVQDAGGSRYVRRYAQGPGGRWVAEARNSAYLTLDSAAGLQVLAVVVGRETGEV